MNVDSRRMYKGGPRTRGKIKLFFFFQTVALFGRICYSLKIINSFGREKMFFFVRKKVASGQRSSMVQNTRHYLCSEFLSESKIYYAAITTSFIFIQNASTNFQL